MSVVSTKSWEVHMTLARVAFGESRKHIEVAPVEVARMTR